MNTQTVFLVVEDNPVNQQVLGLFLQQLSIQVQFASNGQEAVDLIKDRHYSMVLMDIEMPVMDGIEATRQIRSLLPDNRQPVIVALTGHQEETLVSYQKHGFDSLLIKPVKPDDIKKLLQYYDNPPSHTPDRAAAPVIFTPTWQTPFNPYVLDQMRSDIGKDAGPILFSLITSFLDNTTLLFESITKSIQENDIKCIHRCAHTIKSSSANLGAMYLSQLCAALENRLSPLVNTPLNNDDNLQELKTDIISNFELIQQAFYTVSIDLLEYQRSLGSGITLQEEDKNA